MEPSSPAPLTLLSSLVDWTPPAVRPVAAPSPDTLLGGFDAPAWMTDPLARAAPEDPFAGFGAVGTVGRLWAPLGTATSAADALARVMACDDPMARALRWAGALPTSAHADVCELAIVEVGALADAVDELAASGGDDDARTDATRCFERRDVLESVRSLLAPAYASTLGAALDRFDRFARTHASMWRRLSPARSPRLDAVAWQEPDAWWAECARESAGGAGGAA